MHVVSVGFANLPTPFLAQILAADGAAVVGGLGVVVEGLGAGVVKEGPVVVDVEGLGVVVVTVLLMLGHVASLKKKK